MNLPKHFFYLLIIFFLCTTEAISQSNWLNRFGGKGNDEALCNTVSKSGNIYTAGYFSLGAEFGNNHLLSTGSGDVYISCQDSVGNLLWAVRGGGTRSDRAYGISTNDSGFIFVTGTYSGNVTFGQFSLAGNDTTQDIFVAKLDSVGNFIWVKSFGGPDNDLAFSIAADKNGNAVIVGQFKGTCQFGTQSLSSKIDPNTNLSSYDIFILKLDTVGDVVWVKQGLASYDDRANSIVISETNEIYVTGQFSDSITFDTAHNYVVSNAGFILKLNESGQEQWFKAFFGSQLSPRSIFNFQKQIGIAGDYSGIFNYDGQTVLNLNGPKNYNYFILLVDSDGVLYQSKGAGSDHPLSLTAANALGDSIYVAGTFRCTLTDFSSIYGTGIFNSVGFRDIFVAGYNQLLERNWERQLGGPGDDFVSSIAISKSFNTIIAGSFQSIFNAPSGNTFIPNAVTFDSSFYGPQQFTFLCGDPHYGSYKSIYSEGFKDILSASAIDLSRLPYDYFERTNFNCIRDSLLPYINQNNDSLIACDHIRLYAHLRTGRDGVIGPKYNFTWSDGSVDDTILVTQSGWYVLQIQTVDECRIYVDSVYVTVYITPSSPIIATTSGRLEYAIPEYCCYHKLLSLDSIPTYLYCTNVPPGYPVFWYTPSGYIYNDSVLVNGSGCYSCYITVPGGYCRSSECIEVKTFFPPQCFPSNFTPKLIFTNQIFEASDTVEICENEFFSMELVDSIAHILNLHPDIIAMVNWQISGGFNFYFPLSAPYTFLQHQQTFEPSYVGSSNCSITIIIQDPITSLPHYIITRNFFLIVNPLPIPTSTFIGPLFICPGDTVSLVVRPSRHCIFSGPGIVFTNANGDSIRVVAQGYYSAKFLEVDSITGCSQSVELRYKITTTPSPVITMFPANGILCPGDSVLLTAENGSHYEWNGPLSSVLDTTQSIYVSAVGLYHYTVTDSSGCRLISEFSEVKEYSTPYLTSSPSPVICLGGEITISVQTNNPYGIVWDSPLSGNSETQTITSPGIYTCTVFACGINTALSINVTLSQVVATIDKGDTITICQGDTLTLNANGGMANYNWIPSGTTSQSFNIYNAGMYVLQTQDLYGCIAFDTIRVDTFPRPAAPQTFDDVVCVGTNATLSASAAGPLFWYDTMVGGNLILNGNPLLIQPLLATTNYFVATNDGRCNSIRTKVTAFVNPVSQPPIISNDSVFCDMDTIQLNVPLYPTANYQWLGPNSFSSLQNNILIPLATTINTGYYSIQISDSQCTGPIDSIYVTVRSPLVVQILSQSHIPMCPGDTVILYTNTIYSHYKWLPNNYTNSILNVFSTGNYSLIATDNFGCTGLSNVLNVTQAIVPPAPVISGVTSLCETDTLSLAISNIQGATYSWHGPLSSNSLSQDTSLTIISPLPISGNYTVVGSSVDGCEFSNSIFVIIQKLQNISVLGKTNLCYGDSLQLQLLSPSLNGLVWQGPKGFSSSAYVISIPNMDSTRSGIYYLATTKGLCKTFDSINVRIEPLRSFSLGNDTVVCNGEEFNLTVPGNFNSYTWNFSQSNSQTALIDTTGLWIVNVTYGPGCTTSDSIFIDMINCNYFIPNVITPNGDGNNDVMKVNYPSARNVNVKIMNRWGKNIREISGIIPSWDGTDDNQQLVPEGSYFYSILVTDYYNRQINLKGSITVMY